MLILVLLILFIGVIIYMTDLKHQIKYIDLRKPESEKYTDDPDILEDDLADMHDAIARDPEGGQGWTSSRIDMTHIRGRRMPTSTKAYMHAMTMRDQDMNDNVEGLSNNEYVTIPSKKGRTHRRQQSEMEGTFN